jgi:membrane peptidoglycan carboxypeptidase
MASRALRRRSSYRAINGHRRERSRPWLRFALVACVAIMMVASGTSAVTLLFYGQSLPTVKDFKAQFQFQNTRILDRNGHVLYNLADLSKSRGRRIVKPLVAAGQTTQYYKTHNEDWLVGEGGHGIPVALQNATVATEDATFYNNPGFDPLSIVRAGYDDLTKGHVVSGASTITQQLIKQYLLGAAHAAPTLTRKVEEVVLAWQLTQKYPKSKILWYYLNSVPYGNLSVGAQAAAQTYFHTDVWNLDQAQCAFLAGLPQAPTTYNPVTNLPAALERMREVLHLMYIHGYLVDQHGKPDPSLAAKYLAEAKTWNKFEPPRTHTRYPHFVQYVIQQLQLLTQNYKALNGKIFKGLDVYTTLDQRLQNAAQSTVESQISQLGAYNVSDGALVSIDLRRGPPDYCYGCIRAMVGSADYNAPGGQINMANSPRQPGSSFKPFNYIYAFENGLGPATVVNDAPIAIPDVGNAGDGGSYAPENYDKTFHGPVTLRVALDNSLNIPAVKVEEYDASVGGSVKNTVAATAVKLGISSFNADNPECCGWALTLGGMERGVRLVEETAAFGAFATMGHKVTPIAIRKVVDRTSGKTLYTAKADMDASWGNQVVPAADAYIMDNVLSDNSSRCTPAVCEFGLDSPLNLGRPAGAKTGTTNNFTDNWTVGYTPDLVTGVWVGNANNQAMVGTTGITGAAPIWHDYMLKAFDILKLPPKDFQQPPGVYTGYTCRQPTGYGGAVLSSFNDDIYAPTIPWCAVGDNLSTSQTNSAVPAYTPPDQTTQPPPVAPTEAPAPPTEIPAPQPTTPPAPVVQQPAPTAIVAPTQVVEPPTQVPVQLAPTEAPPAQAPTAVLQQPIATPGTSPP